MKDEYHKLGYRARMDKRRRAECPFPASSAARASWMRGYDAACIVDSAIHRHEVEVIRYGGEKG